MPETKGRYGWGDFFRFRYDVGFARGSSFQVHTEHSAVEEVQAIIIDGERLRRVEALFGESDEGEGD